LHVHAGGHADLAHVGEAGGLAGLLASLRKDREENSGKYRDNGDHDEQFDQRETRLSSSTSHRDSPVSSKVLPPPPAIDRPIGHADPRERTLIERDSEGTASYAVSRNILPLAARRTIFARLSDRGCNLRLLHPSAQLRLHVHALLKRMRDGTCWRVAAGSR